MSKQERVRIQMKHTSGNLTEISNADSKLYEAAAKKIAAVEKVVFQRYGGMEVYFKFEPHKDPNGSKVGKQIVAAVLDDPSVVSSNWKAESPYFDLDAFNYDPDP